MAVTDWCVSKSCFFSRKFDMPINIGSISDCWHKLRVWWLLCDTLRYHMNSKSYATIALLGKSMKGCDRKNSQFVMIDIWDICTTWNVSKEGGLMTTTFLNSWIWFTCILLMVHICDKKRYLTLYIFRYVHDALISIMTAVTFEENLKKKCECLQRNVR